MDFINKGKILTEFPEFLNHIKTDAKFVLILEKETVKFTIIIKLFFLDIL